jgi:putative SOS response-associated peptidase YedK
VNIPDVRTRDPSTLLAGDSRPLSAHRAGAAAEPSAELQPLPDGPDPRRRRAGRLPRARADALGLVPGWWKKSLKDLPATFNARAETVAEKPMFRDAFQRRRCLIPISGYFEWVMAPDGKQPFYFTRADAAPITVAGLWDEWTNPETGAPLRSCTMIITGANDFTRKVHDRMPVILEPESFAPWLSGNTGTEFLRPAANDVLQTWPVSRRVNSSRAPGDDPTLIDPVALPAAA